ncbi:MULTISPECIES: type I polyketide synthase [Streptomyces]|uniref:type I polyketide synthase n=1 Tax=Streptomyces TaxID=1883 RepID=UPI001C8E6533|nr:MULTISPECIES: type I polyketide synthase [Streptomyces]UBI36164.1 acyltransferase domain-containing protein [Streptomyces mobaraensis]UKW28759.1 acyltransferase domain-containing protein [Streptomyces sp. TYQ1024]
MLQQRESVALIGIGCRFPGGIDSPESFWNFLSGGKVSVEPTPEDRWRPYTKISPEFSEALRRADRPGNFIGDVDGFDAEFFGITPREAEFMDPQQRLVLEVAWEALEHAGMAPRSVAGSDAGVYIGTCSDDYGRRLLEDLPRIEPWTGIGAQLTGIANRVSHVLDLHGPSFVLDSACSASLVAVHLACQSLLTGETSLALAGGVNIILSPAYTLTLEAAGALSPDGRSKPFDAEGDGYGRAEGCGVLVLKRLADAERDGDRILAVIRGSAVAQDGATNGIMAPNPDAQRDLLRLAWRQAGLDPATAGYIEAHGTGTRLGDPVEASGLHAVFGTGRPDGKPCWIGSVKSNIGHAEPASGVAGIIKATLMLREAELAATVLTSEPSPDIPWDDWGLRLVTEHQPWPKGDTPRRAGVSGYGYGGTIGHIVLEEAPAADEEPVAEPEGGAVRAYPLSYRSRAGITAYAARLADWLEQHPGTPLSAVGHTLATRRSHLEHRATVVADGRAELVSLLRELAADETGERQLDGVVTGAVPPGGAADTGTVWVFSGHGSHWPGMGAELLAERAEFAAVIDALEPVFREELGFSARQALLDGDFDSVDRAQSMIFAMQVGLAEVWRAHGHRPSAVIGHSVGEIAAAVVAGALSLEDGARLSGRRSALLRRVAGRGAMAMVGLPFDEVAARLADDGRISAAIASSPLSSVVSGDAEAVAELVRDWQAEGLPVRNVNSDVAFHSRHMLELTDGLRDALQKLAPRAPEVPLYTTALADPRSDAPHDAAYWVTNLREPVRLAQAVTAAVEDGYRRFLEVSPHPVVSHSIGETLAHLDVTGAHIGHSLRRDKPEVRTLLGQLGGLHAHGAEIDWSLHHPAGPPAELPPVVWQHRRHWLDAVLPAAAAVSHQHDISGHTLLGAPVDLATTNGTALRLWNTVLDEASRPFPGGHSLHGASIVPASSIIHTFLEAAPGVGGSKALFDLSLRFPIALASAREVQVVREGLELRLSTRAVGAKGGPGNWLTHTSGSTLADSAVPFPDAFLTVRAPDGLVTADPSVVIGRLDAIGVEGIAWPWEVRELLQGENVLRAVIHAPAVPGDQVTWAPLLDAALGVVPVIYGGPPTVRMPAHIREVRVVGEAPETGVVDIRLVDPETDTVDIVISDESGRLCAWLPGTRFGALRSEAPAGRAAEAEPTAGPDEPAAVDWASLPADALAARIDEEVCGRLAREMKIPAAELDRDRPLTDLGLDSVMSMVVCGQLEKLLGIRLPVTVLWNHPTAGGLAAYVAGQLGAREERQEEEQEVAAA